MTTDQKIEVYKIIIGALISIVGALWTYAMYTENERANESKMIIELGNAIAGMHVTCKSDFGKLAVLADEISGSRKGRCYEYFQEAHRRSMAAMISIKKPMNSSYSEWASYWQDLRDEIARAGTEKYAHNNLETAWESILIKKGLRERLGEEK